MKPLHSIMLMAFVALAGCRMGPNYQRPGVDAGAQFRGAPAQADVASLADLPWWEVFKDRQLQEYIRVALENNKDLRLAVARVAEARAIVGVTRADLFPQLFGFANGSRTRLSEETNKAGTFTGSFATPAGAGTFTLAPSKTDKYVNLYQAGIDLSYEIDVWGRLRRATEAARADLLATEDVRRTVVSNLVSDVARNYFQLRELDLELEIAKRTHESRVESERLIRLRFDYGRANGLDLERAVGETASTGAAMAQIEYKIAQAENALGILLGRNPGDIARGMRLTEQPPMPEVPPGLPASLIERRPDVLAAEAGLIAENARVGEAKAQFFPAISLTGLFGFESNELNNWFTHRAHTWQVAGNLSQPIFQGGRIYFNYKAVKARREQALTDYLNAIQQALREVADALAARKYSYEERVQREKQVAALTHASDLANQRYEGGRSDYLDVLDAEREQFSAELSLAQSQLSELVSVVQLYRALGGGWLENEPVAQAAMAKK
ncbi:efflux transporter outer membrane subunit [bacterium]|nr:efflux transporter outer membrane subunit [bacterium]